jgi:hypothetical protein
LPYHLKSETHACQFAKLPDHPCETNMHEQHIAGNDEILFGSDAEFVRTLMATSVLIARHAGYSHIRLDGVLS